MMDYDLKNIPEWPLPARAIIFTLAAVSIFAIGYFIDISPYRNYIVTSVQQEADLKRQIQSLIESQVKIKNEIAQLPTLKAKLKDWQTNIVDKADLPAMLNEVLKTAQNNHLKIINFDPGNESKDGIYHKTPVNIDVVGTYDQIAQYVSDLANMSKLVNIDTVFIYDSTPNQPSADNTYTALNSDEVLSAEIDIEIYTK